MGVTERAIWWLCFGGDEYSCVEDSGWRGSRALKVGEAAPIVEEGRFERRKLSGIRCESQTVGLFPFVLQRDRDCKSWIVNEAVLIILLILRGDPRDEMGRLSLFLMCRLHAIPLLLMLNVTLYVLPWRERHS
jgi:hypothetical protein